ncbi:MAG TPA: dTMP kinase [Nitrosomonas sp.]|nr:dTMP kinase [Nitrosomonas sp.]HMW19729.1 dTMP kinase [Nitrosomonas sp.]HMW68383.1 dTMP kinase [Nitrosomonas sp.]HMY60999.1 dTMP kinase [Nitrosomonas sp.]HMY89737.1 dTMP kinase [Nitrosomonas sp.]
MQKGKFITLEGIDGAGKSTHLKWIANYLTNKGIRVLTTREPGGTELGESIRGLLLDHRQIMHAETEALLMFAARREHLDKLILPALDQGNWVISDRFTDASYAYQGGGRGVSIDKLQILENWVQGQFQPDLTFYFDLSIEVARLRMQSIKIADRFEKEQNDFFHRVRAAYITRAKQFPERMQVLDASRSIDDITHQLEKVLQPLLIEQKP